MSLERDRISRRTLIGGLGGLTVGSIVAPWGALATVGGAHEPIRGMYVHRAWPYRRPYAARAWTLADWRGFAEGLGELGFNTVVVWPVIEIMPLPPTPSDTADLELLAGVIEMLHGMRMKVFTTLCPNIVANDAAARAVPFHDRHYFHSLDYVDPADHAAIEALVAVREEHLRPLRQMDGCVIIDSDTGSFPGAKNDDFVSLLVAHRRMLDRLRPGIELLYWMHVGWEAYGRYHATGTLEWASRGEVADLLAKLEAADPAPWGISVHSLGRHADLEVARERGLESRAVFFNYGAIEGEPTFPMTNFGGDNAFQAGRFEANQLRADRAVGARGVVGNAQTHCLQLPNIFAFSRGFTEAAVAEADFVSFANDLVPGHGELIVAAWQALAGDDAEAMRRVIGQLATAAAAGPTAGRLGGLVFGDPGRFLADLGMQLEVRLAGLELVAASEQSVDAARLKAFVAAAERWQGTHGYQCMWNIATLPTLDDVLRKLGSARLDALLAEKDWWSATNPSLVGATPFERHQDQNRKWDTHTVRVLAVLREIADTLAER
jgi:hypothetical protein